MAKTDITAQRLRELLHYDQETGIFRWLAPRRGMGSRNAGTTTNLGYIAIKVGHDTYVAHRLAWLHVTGEWPNDEIDHLDGNRSNNKFANLRDVSRSVNMQNRHSANRDSQSGCLGVYPSRYGKWTAVINIEGQPRWLGTFETIIDARAAYLRNKRQFHLGCTI